MKKGLPENRPVAVCKPFMNSKATLFWWDTKVEGQQVVNNYACRECNNVHHSCVFFTYRVTFEFLYVDSAAGEAEKDSLVTYTVLMSGMYRRSSSDMLILMLEVCL